jgi:hypothetical protein
MKQSLGKQGPRFMRPQLVNHAFLRDLEGSHVITTDDPDGIHA